MMKGFAVCRLWCVCVCWERVLKTMCVCVGRECLGGCVCWERVLMRMCVCVLVCACMRFNSQRDCEYPVFPSLEFACVCVCDLQNEGENK